MRKFSQLTHIENIKQSKKFVKRDYSHLMEKIILFKMVTLSYSEQIQDDKKFQFIGNVSLTLNDTFSEFLVLESNFHPSSE